MTTELTEPERRAARWHDEQVEADPEHEQFSSCWCCCISCDPDSGTGKANPHYDAARAAMKEATR